MPVIVDQDQDVVAALLRSLPAGSQGVASVDRMRAWLAQHEDEYVVVLGPTVEVPDALALCDYLRTAHPTLSVVLVRYEMTTEVLAAAMQAGARDVVPGESPEALSAAVTRAYQLFVALRGPGGANQSGKVITVWSPKGGVGKTTMSVNLGLALTEGGARRVCVVDLDLAFGDVAITLQLFPTHSIEHAVGSENSVDADLLNGLLTRHGDSLMILAAPAHPDVRDRVSATLVAQILRTLKQSFDFVVVDTAPAFDEQTLTALDETDEIVIVATLDVPTLKNVKIALETLDMLNVAPDRRHLVLNRADDEVGISPDRVEGILGIRPSARVATSLEVAASTNAGSPIVVKNPHHPTSTAIIALASELAGGEIATPVSASADEPAPEQQSKRRLRRRR
ncbi:pilus assembly protein CpaE [Nocardioides terrae]|uniref:Pilus assembly protein CpaE n=1 Tax=Nocardioides terrae TaxID=574651 RepID=A0A1I1G2V5_9ACTN|nr:AAA family ATPase [Nocardioides terrae]SFC06159.1 pilus assembly protein CpaE [Nocardioides terrae]